MLFCCLWRSAETSSHKYFVVVSRHQQTPPLTTSDKCHNLRDGGPAAPFDNTCLVAALTARREARYRLRIAISAYPACIRPIRPLVGILPCRLVWKNYKGLATRWRKKIRRYVYSF